VCVCMCVIQMTRILFEGKNISKAWTKENKYLCVIKKLTSMLTLGMILHVVEDNSTSHTLTELTSLEMKEVA